MSGVRITQKPIGIPGDDTHFIVTQPELPEGYTPTGQETEEELAELKVESVREIEMDAMVALIQEKLDMDETPTTGSSKLVTSGGIKAALDLMDESIDSLNEDITNLETNKQDALTFDQTPTAESANPVTSAGIKAALDAADAEIGELKENITNIGNPPKIVETEETDADLYVADDDGYVAVKIENGHIKTAKFNSDNIPNAFPTDVNTALNIADKNGYVALQLSEGHIKTKCFDSSLCAGLPEYRIENGNLYLSFGYTNENDAVVVMNVGRANNLFDFASFKLKSKGVPLNLASLASLESVWTSSSDMHSPFQFYVLNNPDGYWSGSTNPGYSGGNHTQTINDTVMKTASSRYVHFFVDGKPVSSGYGTFSKFEIKWANNVQAYNCIKADGTGRTSLIEYHDMIFDGIKFDETVTLVPQEDIKLKLWEAFATVSWGSTYNKIRFIDGENRNEYNYVSGETYKSGNSVTSGMILTGASHGLEMRMDITCDLGKRTFYHGDAGAHTGGQKAYFYVIYETTQMAENDAYFVHGSFRFFPVVA